jgi:hypothetical protein
MTDKTCPLHEQGFSPLVQAESCREALYITLRNHSSATGPEFKALVEVYIMNEPNMHAEVQRDLVLLQAFCNFLNAGGDMGFLTDMVTARNRLPKVAFDGELIAYNGTIETQAIYARPGGEHVLVVTGDEGFSEQFPDRDAALAAVSASAASELGA